MDASTSIYDDEEGNVNVHTTKSIQAGGVGNYETIKDGMSFAFKGATKNW